MSQSYDLRHRTCDFALWVIRLYQQLPNTGLGEVLGKQVLRSGTSVGAHFREAIRARSSPEYTSKLTGGLMELEETVYWLELIQNSELQSEEAIGPLRKEARELTAIFISLIKKSKPEDGHSPPSRFRF